MTTAATSTAATTADPAAVPVAVAGIVRVAVAKTPGRGRPRTISHHASLEGAAAACVDDLVAQAAGVVDIPEPARAAMRDHLVVQRRLDLAATGRAAPPLGLEPAIALRLATHLDAVHAVLDLEVLE